MAGSDRLKPVGQRQPPCRVVGLATGFMPGATEFQRDCCAHPEFVKEQLSFTGEDTARASSRLAGAGPPGGGGDP